MMSGTEHCGPDLQRFACVQKHMLIGLINSLGSYEARRGDAMLTGVTD